LRKNLRGRDRKMWTGKRGERLGEERRVPDGRGYAGMG